jgi:hypothetical protein
MAVCAHQTAVWAILWTRRAFGWTLLLTYVLLWGWAIHLSPRPRLSFFRGITCTVALAGILLCMELPALLKLTHWELVLQSLTGDAQNLTWAYKRDRELGFRRQPYGHWSGRPTSDIEYRWLMPPSLRKGTLLTFTYDQWGYRNTKSLVQADVALIGDSYVEGWYVSDAQTTAHRLEAHLGRSVVNLGVSGYGTLQEFLVLKKDAVRFNPKVVIWFFFEGNDLYDDHNFENYLLAPFSAEQTTATPERLAQDQSWTKRSFTRAALRQLRRWSTPILPSKNPHVGYLAGRGSGEHPVYFASYAAIPWDAWVASRWEKARETLAQGAAFAQARGIQVLFVFVPIKFRVYRPFVTFAPDSPCHTWDVWPIDARFDEFCQTTGVPCLNLTELFQTSICNGGMPYSAVDTHWSPEGHDLVARHLATELHQRGWLASPSSGH